MKTIVAIVVLFAVQAFAEDHWYVEIDPATGVEMASYKSATNRPALSPRGWLVVEITEADYEADACVAPQDRLKNIQDVQSKIEAARVAAYDFKANQEYEKVAVTLAAQNAKLPEPQRVSQAEWVAVWKTINTNLFARTMDAVK